METCPKISRIYTKFTPACKTQNPYLMEKHGIAGRKRLETHYSWENNAKVLQDIYGRIVAEK